jgi:hypothetical protein
MRRIVGVMACIGLGAVAVALADDPPSSSAPAAAQPTSSATAATPAQSAAPAATTAAAAEAPKPAVDLQEKHFLSEGYKIEMHNGEKYFCRREEEMGTRLGSNKKVCATAQQLALNEQQSKQGLERYQSYQTGPSGK